MPREKIANVCINYIRKERVIGNLKKKLEEGRLEEEDLRQIKQILEIGGPRSLLQPQSQ